MYEFFLFICVEKIPQNVSQSSCQLYKIELNLEQRYIQSLFVVSDTLGCTGPETARCHFGITEQFVLQPFKKWAKTIITDRNERCCQ